MFQKAFDNVQNREMKSESGFSLANNLRQIQIEQNSAIFLNSREKWSDRFFIYYTTPLMTGLW